MKKFIFLLCLILPLSFFLLQDANTGNLSVVGIDQVTQSALTDTAEAVRSDLSSAIGDSLFLVLLKTAFGDSAGLVIADSLSANSYDWASHADVKDSLALAVLKASLGDSMASAIDDSTDDVLTEALASAKDVVSDSLALAVLNTAVGDSIAAAINDSLNAGIYSEGEVNLVHKGYSGTDNQNINIIPNEALSTGEHWTGIRILGDSLDPSGVDTRIRGFAANFSGVDVTHNPNMDGFRAVMPFGYPAFRAKEGGIEMSTIIPSTAYSVFTGIDVSINPTSQVVTSEYHALDVSATSIPNGDVVAVGTHPEVDVIHQHIGTFGAADAVFKAFSAGSDTTDITTAAGSAAADSTILQNDNDALLIGHASKFSEIEITLNTTASVDAKLEFYFSLTNGTWIEFVPDDDTFGMTEDGVISFTAGDLTSWATYNFKGTARYWIKIVRTKGNLAIDPIENTIKILEPTEYYWDKAGAISALSYAGNVTLAPTETISMGDPTALTDGQYMGNTIEVEAGEALVVYDLCYIKWHATAPEAWEVDATTLATVEAQIVMCLEASLADGVTGTFLTVGYIREDDWTWVAGDIWNSTTTAQMSQTPPATTDEYAKIVGHAWTGDIMEFNPSADFMKVK